MENLLSNNSFFELYPTKILGEVYDTTNRFGGAIKAVKGTMEDVNVGIAVKEVIRFEHFKSLIKLDEDSVSKKIKTSIQKTKAQGARKKAQNDKCVDGLECLADSIAKYNPNLSDLEIKVFVTYQVLDGLYDKDTILSNDWKKYYVKDSNFLKKNIGELVAYDGRGYVPSVLYYSGNVYSKIQIIKHYKDAIINEVGEDQYNFQIQKLEESKPRQLVITDGEEFKLTLTPFDKLFNTFTVSELADGTTYDEPKQLVEIFTGKYLDEIPPEDFKDDLKNLTTSRNDITRHWIVKENFSRGTDKSEKANRKRAAQTIGSVLFDRFLFESLTREDRLRLQYIWNVKHNNYTDVDYGKIPVGFSINERFKGGKLEIRPAQREGVGFLNVRGTGIVAYDVGVGKTMTAILSIEDGIRKGLFKNPLVVVPNGTYEKWIGETVGVIAKKNIKKGKKIIHKKGELIAEGILPQYKINDYYNLGVNVINRAIDKDGNTQRVEEGSITFVTFEGLMKFGFLEETQEEMVDRIVAILSQGETGRGAELLEEKIETIVEKGLDKTEVFIEDMGIDAIIVDEAHNYKNLFKSVRGEAEETDDGGVSRGKKDYEYSSGGEPSARAVKLFMLNTYIQKRNRNRNTIGLTATPFTNSPLEVYSMLAHFAFDGLKKHGLISIVDFFNEFIDESYDSVWTTRQQFEVRAVIKGFRNLPTLQSIIYKYINYKTGEEANIQRPEKITLPLRNDDKGITLPIEYQVPSEIPPTSEQLYWFKEIAEFAKDEDSELSQHYPANSKGVVEGKDLIAINSAMTATLSPYLIPFKKTNPESITKEDFIKSSPKLQYVIKCIASVKSYHESINQEVSGQVIYMNRGTKYFFHIKDYLIEYVGFKPTEIAIIDGSTSAKSKERIKDQFLRGDVKILIGSSTIKEGIDLQKRSTVLYNCFIDWNPTDLQQLEGRIWRFGNIYSHVRIVLPLLENSFDVFSFQKLGEKTARVNSIWSRGQRTTVLKLENLNPEELKRGLITNPKELAQWEIDADHKKALANRDLAQLKLNQLISAQSEIQEVFKKGERLTTIANKAITDITAYAHINMDDKKGRKAVESIMSREITDMKSIYRIVKAYAKLSRNYDRFSLAEMVDTHIKKWKKLVRIERDILKKNDLTLSDNFQSLIDSIQIELDDFLKAIEEIKSPDNFEEVHQRIIAEQEARQQSSASVDERVRAFDRLNFLLECANSPINRGNVCNIYGIDRGDGLVKVEKSDSIHVLDLPTPYEMSPKLKKILPPPQKSVVRGWELNTLANAMKPLDEVINAIPKLYSQDDRKKDRAIVYAHFFSGASDWYILEWGYDGKEPDQFFGYTILNGDTQNGALGYLSLSQFHNNSKGLNGIQLDFHWTPKYLAEALYKNSKDYPEPKFKLKEEIRLGNEKLIAGVATGDFTFPMFKNIYEGILKNEKPNKVLSENRLKEIWKAVLENSTEGDLVEMVKATIAEHKTKVDNTVKVKKIPEKISDPKSKKKPTPSKDKEKALKIKRAKAFAFAQAQRIRILELS